MELSFILSCLTHRLDPDRQLPTPPEELDWSRVYRLLVDNRLAGLFCVLGRENPGLWPREVQQRLLEWRYTMLLRGDRCAAQVCNVLTALRQADLPAIVLKGWTLIPTLYAGDYGQRFYEDIDLLVLPQDAARAESILRDLAYQGTVREPWPGYMRRYGSTQAYAHIRESTIMGRGFGVGLHLGLLSIPYYDRMIQVDGLFERALPLQIDGLQVLRLSPEDDLVYSCGHLALHHAYEESLHRYFEMASIVAGAGRAFRWDAVVAQASEWRLIVPLQRTIARLKELWPALLTSDLLDTIAGIRPGRAERYMHNWSVAHRNNHTVRALLDWLALPGVRTRGHFLLETAFPSPDYMRQRYGPAPAGWWPLLYFRRGAAAARQAIRGGDRPTGPPPVGELSRFGLPDSG
jgi:hypothetical protein